MKVAALDLGTNTFLCLIAEVEAGSIKKIYEDQVQVVRLGQGMNRQNNTAPKSFHPEALARAKTCLTEFSQLIKKHQPEKILAMATSAARDADNAKELFSIGKDLNIPIEIIPGTREAEITYQGSISGQKDFNKNFLVVDIGGGSTEIIFGHDKQLKFYQSLDIGCVRLTERFLRQQPATKESLTELRQEVIFQITKLKNSSGDVNKFGKIDMALAVAGTPTELARIQIGEFIPEKIDGFKITLQQLEKWFAEFSKLTPGEITSQFGVSSGRADVILAGVIILAEFCKAFNLESTDVSTRGVRFGVALEIEKRESKKI